MHLLWAFPPKGIRSLDPGPWQLVGRLEPGDACMAKECVYFPLCWEETQQGSCWIPSQPDQQDFPLPPQAGHMVLGSASHQPLFRAILHHFILPQIENWASQGHSLVFGPCPGTRTLLSPSCVSNHCGALTGALLSLASVSPFSYAGIGWSKLWGPLQAQKSGEILGRQGDLGAVSPGCHSFTNVSAPGCATSHSRCWQTSSKQDRCNPRHQWWR